MNVEVRVLKRAVYQGESKSHIVWVMAPPKRRMPVYTGTQEQCHEFILALRRAI